MSCGWGKLTLDSESRARSNNPRLPWQAPRLTLTYWLTSTKEQSRSTATHPTQSPPTARETTAATSRHHDGAQAPEALTCRINERAARCCGELRCAINGGLMRHTDFLLMCSIATQRSTG